MYKPIIQFEDYKRIFNTAFSVLNIINAPLNHSCIYFSVIGSFILSEKYRLDPKVYMGIAAYMLDENKNNVLTFAEKKNDKLVCSENGFHSWIVANDWVIDFTAPLFPRMIRGINKNTSCESKMFQKPLGHMCASMADLKYNGDFFLFENIAFANKMMDIFANSKFHTRIIEICCQWYQKPPSEMKKMKNIVDWKGKEKHLFLKSNIINGRW